MICGKSTSRGIIKFRLSEDDDDFIGEYFSISVIVFMSCVRRMILVEDMS